MRPYFNKKYEELEKFLEAIFFDEDYERIEGDVRLLFNKFLRGYFDKKTSLKEIEFIKTIVFLSEDLLDPANYPGYEILGDVTNRAYEDDNEARLWLKSFIEEMKRLLNEFLENHWDPEKGYRP